MAAVLSDARAVGAVGDDTHAFLLTGMLRPWAEIWPHLRTLTVA